jgi:hypothetical protein
MADQDIDAANMRRRVHDAIRVRPLQKLPHAALTPNSLQMSRATASAEPREWG